MALEFFVDCHPPTATAQHKSVRIVRSKRRKKLVPVFFEAGDVAAARVDLKALFARFAPKTPLAPPLKLDVVWTFYWTGQQLSARRAGKLPEWVWKFTRPDDDNLVKMLKDVMTKLGFWKDDAHVAETHLRRGHGDRPGIHIRIESLNPLASGYTFPDPEAWP